MRQQSEELNRDSEQRHEALEKMRADKQARIEKAYQGWDAVPDELRTESQLRREGLYLPSNAQPAAEVYSEHTFYSLRTSTTKEGTMQMRGLFVGLTTIDIHYLADTFPPANAKTVARAFAMTVGGPATNAAITFAHLGGSSHLLSVIGQHPFTSFIEHELQQYHVALTDLCRATTQLPTISSIATTPAGQRAILNHPVVFPLQQQGDHLDRTPG